MRHAGKEPFPVIYVDGKEEGVVSDMGVVADTLAYWSDNCLFSQLCQGLPRSCVNTMSYGACQSNQNFVHTFSKNIFGLILLFSLVNQKYEPAAKSQLKKITKLWAQEQRKNEAKSQREEEDAEKRNKNLEDAKKIKIEENKSLPPAERIKITHCGKHRDSRVKIYGWVHRLRRQGM